MTKCRKCDTELTEETVRIEKEPCDHCPSGYKIAGFCKKCGSRLGLEAFVLVSRIAKKEAFGSQT